MTLGNIVGPNVKAGVEHDSGRNIGPCLETSTALPPDQRPSRTDAWRIHPNRTKDRRFERIGVGKEGIGLDPTGAEVVAREDEPRESFSTLRDPVEAHAI